MPITDLVYGKHDAKNIVHFLVSRCCEFRLRKSSKIQHVANAVQINTDSCQKMLQIACEWESTYFSSKMHQITTTGAPDWKRICTRCQTSMLPYPYYLQQLVVCAIQNWLRRAGHAVRRSVLLWTHLLLARSRLLQGSQKRSARWSGELPFRGIYLRILGNDVHVGSFLNKYWLTWTTIDFSEVANCCNCCDDNVNVLRVSHCFCEASHVDVLWVPTAQQRA